MKKLFISLLASLALIGCEDSPETKEIRVVQTPAPVVFEFDDTYTMLDVENNYVMCLIANGIDQDDMCEEMCADIYDAESCDTIEDKYEDLYGIGSDSPKMVVSPFKSKSVKSSSKWVYSTPSCTHSPTKASVEKGKSFKQTETCITKKQKTTYYKDGSKFTEYGSERSVTTSMKVGTGKKATFTTGSTTKTTDTKSAAKYSSNLSTSTKSVDTKTVTAPTPKKAEDTKAAAKFSSNLSNSKTTDAKSTSTATNEDKKTAAKFSSNLTTNTTKPTEKPVEETATISGSDVATVAAVGAAAGAATALKPKEPKKVTVVSESSWVKSGKPYSCGTFSPSTSTKPKGKSFEQKRQCKQDEKKNLKMSDGTTKTETRSVVATQSKIAYGTKASSSSSSKSSKSYSSSSSKTKTKKKKK